MGRIHRRRHAFTLLEIMIVMLLLTMVLGGLGVKGYRAIQQQRFNSSVEALISKIALAHQIRLAYHADVSLQLKKKNDEWTCTLTAEQDLPKRMKRFLQRELPLKGILTLRLNASSSQEMTLLFPWTQSHHMTRGNLWLSYDDNKENLVTIPLRGYPSPLKKMSEPIPFEKLNEAPYPEKILQTPENPTQSLPPG